MGLYAKKAKNDSDYFNMQIVEFLYNRDQDGWMK